MSVIDLGTNLACRSPVLAPDWPGNNYWLHWLVFTVIIIVFVLLMVMGYIWIERRGMGRMQVRQGPNRVGPFGLLQPVADAIKVMLKEDIVPSRADKIIHLLAPIVAFSPVLVVFTVIPIQNGGLLADLNVGVLFVVAISAISSVGVFMAGWGSSNKYSLLGGMRDIAAIVSYEMPLVLSLVGVVLLSGTLSLNQIVVSQKIPYVLLQPLGFLIFFICACAEINRSPFDLFEADSELTAGFHTEYSGMKFAMFYLVEYAEAVAMAAIITTFFLSGWKGPGLPPFLWFIIKVILVFFVMVWTRTTLPRVRIDQLMVFAWKFLLPLALINLFITGIEVLAWPNISMWFMVIINIVIMVVLVVAWSRLFKVGWGRVEVGQLLR